MQYIETKNPVVCDICHAWVKVYRMVKAGMVVGTLNVCKSCDEKKR